VEPASPFEKSKPENLYVVHTPAQSGLYVRKFLELSPDVWPGPNLLSEIDVIPGWPQDALREIELVSDI